MKVFRIIFYLIILISFSFLASCSMTDSESANYKEDYYSDDPPYDGGEGNNNQGTPSGVITAGEWNDLDNWSFWTDLLNNQEYLQNYDIWSFNTSNRVSVLVKDSENKPFINVSVEIKKAEVSIWSAKTDNLGKAELWINLFQKSDPSNSVDLSEYTLIVNDEVQNSFKLIEDGVNEIQINEVQTSLNKVELSFIVDATGSMGDEIDFLKNDLMNVISTVKAENSNLDIFISSVFYRDEGDEYLVKDFDFNDDVNEVVAFINNQRADGGGDFPEAVHSGLDTAINKLEWSSKARTRIAFLLLDAPPHSSITVLESLQNSVKQAAKKGIKLIPITASGIDKNTEFITRLFSISTNGTYVFITNDSGVGNDHIEATVGEYQVEKLNELMIRLITKYIQ